MNVEWVFGRHRETMGSELWQVTTDSPVAFKEWLNRMCPSHRILGEYQRSPSSVYMCGGYPWAIQIALPSTKEKALFCLVWKGSR